MKNFLLTLLLIWCCAHQVSAQDEYSDTSIVVAPVEEESYDEETAAENQVTNEYERRYIDESSLEALRKKKEFKYPDLESDTLRWQHQTATTSTGTGFTGFDVSFLLWFIVAVASILVILQLAGVNMRQLFAPARLPTKTRGSGSDENIHEISFDEEISKAVQLKNFARATRLLYLQSLKVLSDRNHITWHENKTNWQYVNEIKTWEIRDRFKYLTSVFEFVHYGHMQIGEGRFNHVFSQFQQFKNFVA